MNILNQISEKESQIISIQSEIENLKNQLVTQELDIGKWLLIHGFSVENPGEYLKEINDRFWLYAILEGEYKLLCIDNDIGDEHDCAYYSDPESFKNALLKYEPTYSEATIHIEINIKESEATKIVREIIKNMSDEELRESISFK